VCERGGIHDFVKVLDFGLVKNQRQGEAGASVAGSIVGTPHYMAPEIVLSRGASPSTDLYALGAVAYFMLTGGEVFPDRTLLGVVAHHVSDPPEPPSTRLGRPLPAALEAVVLQCLAKIAAERPGSAAELREQLRACDLPAWTQEDARAFWVASVDALRAAKTPETSARATPWGETLVVDLQDRGAAFQSATRDLHESSDQPLDRQA